MISTTEFGAMPDGTAIRLHTLTNRNGMEARISNYAGIIVSLRVSDAAGVFADVVLGFDSLEEYLANPGPFFGALIGRYANRIGNARCTIGGIDYELSRNDGANLLHGGARGFDRRVWNDAALDDTAIQLTYVSADGDQGFPGNLSVTVVYRLTDANELRIDYAASTDRETVVNLTNHSYFNLAGAGSGDILRHRFMLNARRTTPVGSGLIPTGELRDVAGTPFDFRKPTEAGARIGANDEQLHFGQGYDHNWVLDRNGTGMALAARVEEPRTGRTMEISTTEPAIQFYSGNFLDGSVRGKGGLAYAHRGGFCLETQHYPDAPNHPEFPSTVLRPGEMFGSTTVLKFGAL
jgi:aldose 1-epimerase